jgi:hypothetical protein
VTIKINDTKHTIFTRFDTGTKWFDSAVKIQKYGINHNIAVQNTNVAFCLLNEDQIQLKKDFLYRFSDFMKLFNSF